MKWEESKIDFEKYNFQYHYEVMLPKLYQKNIEREDVSKFNEVYMEGYNFDIFMKRNKYYIVGFDLKRAKIKNRNKYIEEMFKKINNSYRRYMKDKKGEKD